MQIFQKYFYLVVLVTLSLEKNDLEFGKFLSRLEPETRVIVLREVRGQVLADGRHRLHRRGGLLHSLGPGLRTHQDMRRNPWGTPNSRALATHRSVLDLKF